jgi:hypothetical protein
MSIAEKNIQEIFFILQDMNFISCETVFISREVFVMSYVKWISFLVK